MNVGPIRLSVAAWSAGIDSEAVFWENWVKTGGGRWPQDFIARQQTDRIFDASLEALLPVGEDSRVLDVGAGPMTFLGTRSATRTIHFVAVDPLAALYGQILDTYGIVPPIRTIFATAEDLSAFLDFSSFDLVHCQNALDHSFDPIRGIEEMLRVVKTGGCVVLRHYTDEAEYGDYEGFHQFNFNEKDGRFYVWNRDTGKFPEEHIQCDAIFETVMNPALRSIEVVIRKTGEFPDTADKGRFRDRVRDLTDGLVNHFVSHTIEKLKILDLQSVPKPQSIDTLKGDAHANSRADQKAADLRSEGL